MEKSIKGEIKKMSESKKPTKEEMLEWIGCDEPYFAENSLFSKERNKKIRDDIRRLIENQPRVDEKFIASWANTIMVMRLNPNEDWTESIFIQLKQMLREIPVRIKEERG